MAKTLTGGCACGAVRYELRGEPVRMLNCHCRDCQQASGTAFAAILTVHKSQADIRGQLRSFTRKGESGHVLERGFCPDCGSPVTILPGRAPDYVAVHAGSLDDPSAFRPTIDAYVDSAQPWGVLAPTTQKFPRSWRS